MISQRSWFISAKGYRHVEQTDKASKSLFWYCYQCGQRYAEAKVSPIQLWFAISGCCPECPGSIYYIPGSLEALHLIGQDLPLDLLKYQLNCELNFLSSPSHPHNKEIFNAS